MDKPERFNVRVYALIINDNNQILVADEPIKGKPFTKFPGGGVELGEGLKEALQRELKEELDINFEIGEHFYTTDFFQASWFDKSQVLNIYYKVSSNVALEALVTTKGWQSPFEDVFFRWIDVEDLSKEEKLVLPTDKVVVGMVVDILL